MSKYIWQASIGNNKYTILKSIGNIEKSSEGDTEESTEENTKKDTEKNTEEGTEENTEENTEKDTEEISQEETTATGSRSFENIFPKTFLTAGIAAVVLIAGLICAIVLKKKFDKAKAVEAGSAAPEPQQQTSPPPAEVPFQPILGEAGKVHNIGRRKSQQDSLGVAKYKNGVFAVVADGMGGLSDGDKVSQKIVMTMLQDASGLTGGSTDGMLYQMASHANREVNHMLGVSDRYKSGSTLIAVLAEAGNFQWVSVGDSRIYLYRAGQLLQINREHVYEADLIRKAVNNEISFSDITKDSQKKSVASFIGMGSLKYIDGSMRRVPVKSGDKLLLMSDGIFNTLSEEEICSVLAKTKDAEQAAKVMEEQVLARQNPKQDNFSAIILDI